jgi:hypothetical protein
MLRTYIHVYFEGEPLLRRWVDAAPDGDRDARFRRLLREQLTPGGIATELAGSPPEPARPTDRAS